MDLMNIVLKQYLDLFVIVFIYLRVVLQGLKHHMLFSMFSKYEFWFQYLPFLNNIVSTDGIWVDSQKIEEVK